MINAILGDDGKSIIFVTDQPMIAMSQSVSVKNEKIRFEVEEGISIPTTLAVEHANYLIENVDKAFIVLMQNGIPGKMKALLIKGQNNEHS